MSINEKPRTERGFREFAANDCIAIRESSLAFEGAHVWIFGGRPISNDGGYGSLHANVNGAKLIIAGLQAFIEEAEAGELTEPAEYQEGGTY